MIAVTIVAVLLSLFALLINLPLSRSGRPSGGIPGLLGKDYGTAMP